jgi:hypothetical protein
VLIYGLKPGLIFGMINLKIFIRFKPAKYGAASNALKEGSDRAQAGGFKIFL